MKKIRYHFVADVVAPGPVAQAEVLAEGLKLMASMTEATSIIHDRYVLPNLRGYPGCSIEITVGLIEEDIG